MEFSLELTAAFWPRTTAILLFSLVAAFVFSGIAWTCQDKPKKESDPKPVEYTTLLGRLGFFFLTVALLVSAAVEAVMQAMAE